MNNSGALSFDAVINDAQWTTTLTNMERRALGMTSSVVKGTSEIDSAFSKLSIAAAGYFSFTALAQLPAQLIKVRGEFQQLEIAFSTMLRSKAKADALLGEIKAEALKSPFELKDIAQGAKQLLAYGSSAEGVIGELRALGDVASGVSAPIGDLVYLYGTLRTQGRAYAVDIRQFAGRGIPIYAELAKVLGVAQDKVNGLVSAGKVGFPEVQKAIQNMTSAGGIFEGLQAKQAQSLTGLTSNLADAYNQALNKIGESNEGILAGSIKLATSLVQNYEPILDVLKVLVATYGGYRAAVIAITVFQQIQAISSQAVAVAQAEAALSGNVLTASEIRAAGATGILTAAQGRLNATLLANPYALAAAALIGLIAAIAIYGSELTTAQKAQQALAEARQKGDEEASKSVSKIEALKSAINNENLSQETRQKKLKELIALSPGYLNSLTLQNIKTGEGTAALDLYVASLKRKFEYQKLDAQLQESFARESNIKSGATKPGFVDRAVAAVKGGGIFKTDKEREAGFAAELKAQKDAGIASEQELQKSILGQQAALDGKEQTEANRLEKTKVNIVKTVDFYADQIKKLKDEQGTVSSRSAFDALQKQINAAETAKRRLTGEKTSSEKKADKAAEKVGPEGSLSYYEDIAKKAEESIKKTSILTSKASIERKKEIRDNALEQVAAIKLEQDTVKGSVEYYDKLASNAQERLNKLPGTDTGGIARLQGVILDAQTRSEALKKQIAVKNYDDELAEKKNQYELFQKYIDAYGQASADAQFGKLKASGATYVDFLNAEIAKLEAKQGAGSLSDTETKRLVGLTDNKREATGGKTAIQLFSDDLLKAKAEASSLTAYLDILEKKQRELAGQPGKYEQKALVATETSGAKKERKDQLTQFLQGVAGSEAQAEAIRAKYRDLRYAADENKNGKRAEDYTRQLDAIDKAEHEETQIVVEEAFKQSDAYKALNDVIEAEGVKALVVQRDRIAALLKTKEAASATETQDYKKLQIELRNIDREIEQAQVQRLQKYASLIGDIGSALSSMGGDAGRAGALLSGLSGAFQQVSTALSATKTEDIISAGVGGVVSFISALGEASNQRKQKEHEFYLEVNAQQTQYNLLLNEELGLKTKKRSNVFVADFIGEIKDGLAKYNDAQQKYQESLVKLQAGRVKTGLKDVTDVGGVLKLAGAGAAIGAVLGPVGALVGGIVGGIVGLFGGAEKKADEFASLLKTYPSLLQTGADGVQKINVALAQSLLSNNLLDDSTKLLVQDTLAYQKAMEDAKQQIKDVIGQLAGNLGSGLRDALTGAFKDGTSSARAFGDAVSQVLENILSQILFNAVFSKQFDALQKDLEGTLTGTSQATIFDVFKKFADKSPELIKQYNDGLEALNQAGAATGLNVFKKGPPTGTTLSGSIKGVSEETASILSGQLNAIRITQADSNQQVRQSVLLLTNISVNSNFLPFLKSIDARLEAAAKVDPLRAKGIPI